MKPDELSHLQLTTASIRRHSGKRRNGTEANPQPKRNHIEAKQTNDLSEYIRQKGEIEITSNTWAGALSQTTT